jgi:hypothetical protein
VAGRCFTSSLSEHGRASDGGARRDGARSGGGGGADWRKETASFGLSGLTIGPQAESFWADMMKIKGKL